MNSYSNCNAIGHRKAAEMLGLTPLEFAELRRNGDVPEPDVIVLGSAPRWNYQTIAKYKRYRDRMKMASVTK